MDLDEFCSGIEAKSRMEEIGKWRRWVGLF